MDFVTLLIWLYYESYVEYLDAELGLWGLDGLAVDLIRLARLPWCRGWENRPLFRTTEA